MYRKESYMKEKRDVNHRRLEPQINGERNQIVPDCVCVYRSTPPPTFIHLQPILYPTICIKCQQEYVHSHS